MNYFELTYPNHSRIILKSEDEDLFSMLFVVTGCLGIKGQNGAVFNPKGYLTLSLINSPDEMQKRVAQPLEDALIG